MAIFLVFNKINSLAKKLDDRVQATGITRPVSKSIGGQSFVSARRVEEG
jgi:hypothetical protein